MSGGWLVAEQGLTSRRLRAGAISCVYQDGSLRYLSNGGHELVRLLYCAVRDENWESVASMISEESIVESDGQFLIGYTRQYAAGDIRFEVRVAIRGTASGHISFSFYGCALTTFRRNRIGICVHLPASCAGAPCTVISADGARLSTVFPDLISPHQPFRQIKDFRWQLPGGPVASLVFSGDVFEAEDQRNWSDASFKFYSTPLELPFPVTVECGTVIRQEVEWKVDSCAVAGARVGAESVAVTAEVETIAFSATAQTFPFPALGLSAPPSYLSISKRQAGLLRSMPFSYYRVELVVDGGWKRAWKDAQAGQALLGLPFELVLYFPGEASLMPGRLLEALGRAADKIGSLLLLCTGDPYTSRDLVSAVLPLLRRVCPRARIGAGSDAWFAGWNRNFSPVEGLDFTAFPVCPQVHATDTLTLIENLAAQADVIRTARSRCGNLLLYIGPVSLKKTSNPDASSPAARRVDHRATIDPRQHSLFAAGWTAVSLRYLAGADGISYFEAIGPCGILPSRGPITGQSDEDFSSPLAALLQEIAIFQPKLIHESFSASPLEIDGVLLQNHNGELLAILINFTGEFRQIGMSNIPLLQSCKTMAAAGPAFSRGAYKTEQWRTADPDGDDLRLPPHSLTFFTNFEQHGPTSPR